MVSIPVAVKAQDATVILPAREISVKQAVNEITRQTDYRIAIDRENPDMDRKILSPASRVTVKELLEIALNDTGFIWETVENQIAIIPENNTPERLLAPRSAMHRNKESLRSAQMKPVQDPLSSRRLSAEDIANARDGYWSGDGNYSDSLELATINFRVNKSVLEKTYMDNKRALEIIHNTFSDKEQLSNMEYIVVVSASSPDGSTPFNEKLAAERAMSVKSYLMSEYPFMDRDMIYTFSIGEDWSGLRKLVVDDPQTPYRSEILEIIDSDMNNDRKRAGLKSVGGGNAYTYLAENMLPALRGAAACMIYYKEEPVPVMLRDTVFSIDTVYIDRIVEKPIPIPAAPIEPCPYYFAIKNNLLYDALLLPNLGVEFSLPNRWSIQANGNWSWWKTTNSKHYYHRVQVAGIEMRKWLGKKSLTPLTGHFLGLYGMGGTYDIRFSDTGYLSNWSYSFGIDYGYSKPIGKRLNLEFNIAVGYFGGKYKKYDDYCETHGGFPWKGSYTRNYFGPTKAGVSLVWLIGSGTNEYKNK